jgi:integrase
MSGHIRARGRPDAAARRSWELKFDVGADPATGGRRVRYVSFRGTRREAEAKLRELLSSVDRHAYVEPSKITVTEHMRACLKRWEGVGAISARTAERYGELIERQIVPHIGAHRLQQLKRGDVEEWYGTLRATGRKGGKHGVCARTILHAHRLLRKALAEAVADDIVHKNAAALAKNRPKVEEQDRAVLRPEQITAVLEAMRGRRNYALFVAALFTGLRAGEVAALRWNAIDLDGKVLEVREAMEQTKAHGARPKAPKSRAGRRVIVLPDIVIEALREHRREALEQRVALGAGKLPDAALVFPANEDPLVPRSVHTISRAWRRVARELGLVGVSFHGLRHTHASQLIEGGVDIVTISRRLGHAKPDITLRVYAHLFKQRDDKAATAINMAMAGLGAAP